MATSQPINNTGTGSQVVGKVMTVQGVVKAQAPDNSVRILEVGSPIFLGERIITGDSGMISIALGDGLGTRLDLGRMSDVLVDGDLFPGEPGDFSEAVAEVEQVQQALLAGEFDPTTDFEPTAAGPAAAGPADDGGGSSYVEFSLTGEAVTPTSGAETTGVGLNFLDPEPQQFEESVALAADVPPADTPAPVLAAAAAAPDFSPSAGNFSSFVDEEGLIDGSFGLDPSKTTTGGTFADLGIDFGGDGAGFVNFSHGGNTITVVLDGNPGTSSSLAGTYGTLTVFGNSTWQYTITDNTIDHSGINLTGPADTVPDVFTFTVFDSDGDSASGSLTIAIYDDGPVATGALLSRVVEEEALDNYSPGSSPIEGSDGNPELLDGPLDGPEDEFQPDEFEVTGSLSSLVNMGADNPGTFSITLPSGLPTLFSKGGTITYEMNTNGTTLEAWVRLEVPEDDYPKAARFQDYPEQEEGGDRLIFSLDVQSDGSYTFTLYDQLDHVAGDGENTALLVDGGDPINQLELGAAIIATDADGDSIGFVDRALTFTIVDDVPKLVNCGHAFFYVSEDALGNDNPSWNPLNNPDSDASEGNLEGLGNFLATDRAYFNLSSLVKVGADEQLTWSLKQLETEGEGDSEEQNVALAATLEGDYASDLTSKEATVHYHVEGNTLTGYTGSWGEEHNVIFTFTVDSNTGWATFDLNDQLDHDAGKFADINLLKITDLGQFVWATDYDNDSVNLGESIVVKVENDIPKIALGKGKLVGEVQEDALGNEYHDPAPNDHDRSEGNLDEKGVDTDTAKFSLSSLVKFSEGADDPATVTYGITGIGENGEETDITSKDQNIWYFEEEGKLVARAGGEDGRIVFTFTVDSVTGEAVFNLKDQIDHDPDHLGDDGELAINLGKFVEASIEDADGDTASVNFNHKIVVNVENDVPILNCETAHFCVQEDALGNWTLNFLNNSLDPDNSKGNLEGDSAFSTDHDSYDLSKLVEVGADEHLTWKLAPLKDSEGDYKSNLKSNGNDVYYKVDGNTLTGYTNISNSANSALSATVMNVVFTFSVNAATGKADFNLNDQLDHSPGVSGSDSETLSITDLGRFVNAEDFDGDSVNLDGRIVVSVENDVPTLVLKHGQLIGGVQEDALGNELADVNAADDTDASKGNLDPDGNTDTAVFELSNLINWSSLINKTSPGADELAKITYKISGLGEGKETDFTSNDQTISYFNEDGQLVAKAGGQVIFTFSVDSDTGKATFNLNDQIDHPTGSGDAYNLEIRNLGNYVEASIEDADGDVVSVDFGNKIVVKVENDVPEVVETAQYYFVSEYAGYNNTIGIYELDAEGNPTNPRIIVAESNDLANFSQANPTYFGGAYTEGFPLGVYEAGTKMFLIANGGGAVKKGDKLAFRAKGDGDPEDAPDFILQVETSGVFVDVNEAQGIYYMDSYLDTNSPGSFNGGTAPDGVSHFTDQWSQSPWPAHFISDVPANGGEVRIEDLNFGDGDFDDTVLRVEKGAVVSESNLADGSGDDPNVNFMVQGNFFKPTAAGIQFLVGADEALTLNIASIGIPSLSGPGTARTSVAFDITNDGSLPQFSGTSEVFLSEAGKLEIWSNGDWQYTLLDNTLKNPDNDKGASDKHDGDYDRFAADQVQDIFTITATDTDGDSVATRFIININDDGPSVEAPAYDAILANEAGNSLVADLNIEAGADGYKSVVITPLDENGKPVCNGDTVCINGEKLKIGCDEVKWQLGNDGHWSAMVNSTVLFTVAPEVDNYGAFTGNYTVLQVTEFHREEGFSVDFRGSDNESVFFDDDLKISVSASGPPGSAPYQVHQGPFGLGVDNSKWSHPFDLERFYVNEVNGGGGEVLQFSFTDNADNPLDMTQVTFSLYNLHKTSDSKFEQAKWTAFTFDENDNPVEVGSGQVKGNSSGDKSFTIDLDGPATFNEIHLTVDSTPENFGFIDFVAEYKVQAVNGSYIEQEEFAFDFQAVVTDGDGDTATTNFSVTFENDAVLDGGDGAEVIAGSSLADVIVGGGGDDIIDGGPGNDVIFGGTGDDTVDGGTGKDTLVGGTGADILDGEEGDDTLFPDTVNGSNANVDDGVVDTVTGGPEIDTLVDPGPDPTTENVTGIEVDLDTLIPPPEEPVV